MSEALRPLAVGVDAGGTWIRVHASLSSRRVARASARVARVADLETYLSEVWQRRRWPRHRVASLVVATKGIWTAAEGRRIARRLHRFARTVRVMPDAQAAALGALDGRPGVLVLSGTGSIAIGHDGRGRWARSGGFGPLLGDEGSGFWLGREWVRAATGPGDFAKIRTLAHAAQPVAAVAALAPAVLARARRGDAIAAPIVLKGQRSLAACAADLARRLRLPPPVAMSWAGSVMGDAWFRAGVARAVARAGIRARWMAPAFEPLVAAARLAEALAGRHPRPPARARGVCDIESPTAGGRRNSKRR
jgi:N-acetylglucosamine kinase-like BadF-type ATPase